MVSMLETSVAVFKTLLKEGFTGIWQKLLGMIDGFRGIVVSGMSKMVVTTLIEAGIGWLATLTNPAGAIIKIIMSIYKLIVTFIERFRQIIDVCESIFSSVGAIAKGNVQQAANFIEETIGRTVPLIIAFLAALIPVSGITTKIKAVIKRLQRPIENALGRLIGFLVKKAKKLFSKLIAKVNKKRALPSYNFRIGAKQHHIFAQMAGKKVEVRIASEQGKDIDVIEATHKEQIKLIEQAQGEGAESSKQLAKVMQSETIEADDDTEKAAKAVRPNAKNENQRKRIDKLMAELQETALELETAGLTIDTLPQISSQTDKALFRAAEPRREELEGNQGPHGKLLKDAKKKKFSKRIDYPITSFYEMDHTIEKRFGKVVLENLQLIDPAKAELRKDDAVQGSDERADRAGRYDPSGKTGKSAAIKSQEAPALGEIGGAIMKIPETAPDFPAVAVYRHNHIKDKGLTSHKSVIEQARKTGDPHGHVKSSLKAQMVLEEAEMLAKLEADTTATPKIKKNTKAGIAAARARNEEIFGMGEVAARELAEDEKKKRNNEKISSNLAFGGGNGAPDFLKLEGVGGAYGALPKLTEHLERDHIIDKAYPKNAAALSLLTPGEKAGFSKKVQAQLRAQNKRMSAKRKQRLADIHSAKLYSAGSAMAQYSDASGFAVPLYKPVAREVTLATRGAMKIGVLASKVSQSGEAELISYVIEGKPASLQTVRDARFGGVENVFLARSDSHFGKVTDAYRKNITLVTMGQRESDKPVAKAYMDRIMAQVKGSLVRARLETERLF